MANPLDKKEQIKQLADNIREDDGGVTAEDWDKFDQDLFRFNESEQYAWYGACFGQTKRILTTAIPTACVGYKDGEILFAANPRFLEQLTFHQRCLVYCHEIEHVVRSHMALIEDHPEKAEEYNILADSLINEELLDYNHIWGRQDMPKWKTKDGHDAEMIDIEGLKKMIAEAEAYGGKAQQKLPANLTPQKFYRDYSTEDLGKYIPRKPPEENDDDDPFKKACDAIYGDMGEFFNDGSVPDEVKDALIEQMVDEAQKSRGLTPAHLGPYIEKIKDKTNRDWRMMMRGLGRSSHIKITRSWVKWNKRNPSLSMPLRPGKYFKSLPKVLVMADTSGSIGDGELLHFIKEINGLCERCIIDMAWVDAHFDEDDPAIFHRDIKNARDFHKRAQEPVGRGGTYFDEFYKYAIKHYGEYQHVLMLTDGYSDYIPQRLVPGQQLALMTPMHDQRFVEQAQANGFKVAVIEDLP
jgi:predicted metal-dependent peptidase